MVHFRIRRWTWWRHQMETISALLALCAGNSPVTGEFPAQRPVTRSLDVFYHLRLNKRLNKQPWGWWFETLLWSLWRHCNGICSGIGNGRQVINRTRDDSVNGSIYVGRQASMNLPLENVKWNEWNAVHSNISNIQYRNCHALGIFFFFSSSFFFFNHDKSTLVPEVVWRQRDDKHWGRNKMDAIFQTTISSGFYQMEMYEFRLQFHWSLFLRVQLTIFQHWFR